MTTATLTRPRRTLDIDRLAEITAAAAPPLTDDQRRALARLLPPSTPKGVAS